MAGRKRKTDSNGTHPDATNSPAPGGAKPARKFEALRLLPVVMIASALMFGVKIGNIWQGADALMAGMPEALAEDAAPEESAAESHDDAAGAGEGQEAADADTPESHAPQMADDAYSRGELQLLENLADRRSALDGREKDLEMRERVLTAMEQRIDDKIAEVKRIEAQIESYLASYDEEHLENMKSLVKMYESMKPKDAARIFEQLHMDILLEVAGNMREKKMADILAEMSPDAAKALTVEMATKKPIPLAAN